MSLLDKAIGIVKLLSGDAKTESSEKAIPQERQGSSPEFPYCKAPDKVPSYEDRIKNLQPLDCGLFPVDVLLIYYCEQYQKYTKQTTSFQFFWLNDYGVRYPIDCLKSLYGQGFISEGISTKGKTKGEKCLRASSKGLKVIKTYEGIIWAHKHGLRYDGPISIWGIGYEIDTERRNRSGFTYRDIVWRDFVRESFKYEANFMRASEAFSHDKSFELLNTAQCAYTDLRIILNMMIDFLDEEKRYKEELVFYQRVDDLDKRIHTLNNSYFKTRDAYQTDEYLLRNIQACKNKINKTSTARES